MKTLVQQVLLTIKEVGQKLEISRATIYRRQDDDPHFPRSFQLTGGRAVRWLECEVQAYIDHCAATGRKPPRKRKPKPDSAE